jgi:hypothetical protein
MSATRYEILLPLKYNDGRDIEPDKLLQTKKELAQKFGALSVDPHSIQGLWTHQGIAYEDVLVKFIVDVEEDTPQVEAFFRGFKETLKARFQQLDIWIVAFPIRII